MTQAFMEISVAVMWKTEKARWVTVVADHCVMVHGKMGGRMTCNFTSLLTVLQSYQDDEWVIMEDSVQWNPAYDWKEPRFGQGSNRDH